MSDTFEQTGKQQMCYAAGHIYECVDVVTWPMQEGRYWSTWKPPVTQATFTCTRCGHSRVDTVNEHRYAEDNPPRFRAYQRYVEAQFKDGQ